MGFDHLNSIYLPDSGVLLNSEVLVLDDVMNFMGCIVKLFLIVFLSVAVLLVWLWVDDFFDIDKCMDAGGRWDYDRRRCVDSREERKPELTK